MVLSDTVIDLNKNHYRISEHPTVYAYIYATFSSGTIAGI